MAILVVRDMRRRIFPAEIFDEHAWTMLLRLFVSLADNDTIPESLLIAQAGMSQSTGRRWIAHLVDDQQIIARPGGGDITLTSEGIDRMRLFLDEASQEAHQIEEHGTNDVSDLG